MKRPHILDIVEAAGFKVFENGDYNLNIIGVRTPFGAAVPNRFDDWLHVVYKKNGQWEHHKYRITTEPGKYWLLNGRKKGTAVMCSPQQVRGGWQIGKHRGKYDALCQVQPVRVWRDSDRDEIAEQSQVIEEGIFGINIHRSNPSRESVFVDKWSAGCQVFASPIEFDHFMLLCRQQIEFRGWPTFTYTLITGRYDEEY